MKLSLLSKYRQELMGFSAIGIIMCHACGNDVAMPTILWQICSLGQIGVSMFFFLSGMGMYYSLCKKQGWVIGWYANRYARLLVPYLLMAIPYYLWLSIHNTRGFDSFILDISTLSYYIKGGGVWFVGAIVPLYLLVPRWHKLLNGKPWSWLPTIIIFIVLVYFNEWRHLGEVAFFFLGYWFGKPVSEDGKINVFFAVIVPIVLYIICRSFSFLDWFPRSLLLVMPFLLIAAFCFDKVGQVVKAPFQFMGKISLESYMANVMLPSVFALVPWVVNGVNLNDGNRLLYLCVVVFGVVLAYFVHILSRPIIRRFLEHR